jgi:hypothetical protein
MAAERLVDGRGLVPWRDRLRERGIPIDESPAVWVPPTKAPP